jgi:hypothetical protein
MRGNRCEEGVQRALLVPPVQDRAEPFTQPASTRDICGVRRHFREVVAIDLILRWKAAAFGEQVRELAA